MSVQGRASEISRRMGTHLNDAERIETATRQRYGGRAVRQMPSFKYQLRGTKRKADDLVVEAERREIAVSLRMARLEQAVEQNHNQMQAMQRQINETENELALTQSKQIELMEMKSNLHTGQIAYNFERDLASHIYPPGRVRTYRDRHIFSNLMKWLQDNQHTREGREANKKWNALRREFGWDDKSGHELVFFKMLECRRDAAHPNPIDPTLSISDRFYDNEKKLVEDIRNMADKLSNLLQNA